MYLFANKGLGMSSGKMSAQVAHAAVEAFHISDPELVAQWYVGGHYCKYVMAAEDETHLHTIKYYLEQRGFKTKLIVDEGHTEIRPHTATALGVEIVDKDDAHVAATFGDFKIYRDPPVRPKPDKLRRRRWWQSP
jgi:peptidyl-tRNA hydrolase